MDVYPNVKSRRGKLDVEYRFHALHCLGGGKDLRFFWIADFKKMESGEPRSWKPAILTELGRIGDPESIKNVALALCSKKPKTTKQAIAFIRRIRTGKEPIGDCLDLGSKISKLIDEYMAARPSMTFQMVRMALINTLDIVEEMERGRESAGDESGIDRG